MFDTKTQSGPPRVLTNCRQVSKQLYTSLIYISLSFILYSFLLFPFPISSSSLLFPFSRTYSFGFDPRARAPHLACEVLTAASPPTYEGRMSELNTALPRITIEFCTQCKWMLRAAYVSRRHFCTPVMPFHPSKAFRAFAETPSRPAL